MVAGQKGTRRKLSERFCSCIKKVRKTFKFPKESSAIAICVKSVIQGKSRRRTLKRFSCEGTPKLSLQGSKPLPKVSPNA